MQKRRVRHSFAAAALLVAAAGSAAVVTTADLQVVKTRTTGSPTHPGDVIGYDITVTNLGPESATNVSLTDVIPAHTTFDEGGAQTAPGWNCVTPSAGGTGTMTCTVAAFAANASADFYIELDVDTGSAPPTAIGNTATVTSDTEDPQSSNNSSVVSTDVAPVPTPAGIPTLGAGMFAALAAGISLAGLFLIRR